MPASQAFSRFVLRTTDVPAARAFYSSLLGHDRFRVVPLHGKAIARGARPHWLGQVEVEDAEVVVPGPWLLPSGERLAACDDPQGAAFALRG